MTSARQTQQGFTLVEVVVAFAIFALSVGALYEVFDSGAKRSAQAAVRMRALFDAQSLLAEQRVRPGPWPAVRSGMTADGLAWRLESRLHPGQLSGGSDWQAYDVDVQVQLPQSSRIGAHLRSVELARTLL